MTRSGESSPFHLRADRTAGAAPVARVRGHVVVVTVVVVMIRRWSRIKRQHARAERIAQRQSVTLSPGRMLGLDVVVVVLLHRAYLWFRSLLTASGICTERKWAAYAGECGWPLAGLGGNGDGRVLCTSTWVRYADATIKRRLHPSAL
jgi:hypothetical protein